MGQLLALLANTLPTGFMQVLAKVRALKLDDAKVSAREQRRLAANGGHKANWGIQAAYYSLCWVGCLLVMLSYASCCTLAWASWATVGRADWARRLGSVLPSSNDSPAVDVRLAAAGRGVRQPPSKRPVVRLFQRPQRFCGHFGRRNSCQLGIFRSVQVLDVVYANRPIERFWFLETVARMPYFVYISMVSPFGWCAGVSPFWLV